MFGNTALAVDRHLHRSCLSLKLVEAPKIAGQKPVLLHSCYFMSDFLFKSTYCGYRLAPSERFSVQNVYMVVPASGMTRILRKIDIETTLHFERTLLPCLLFVKCTSRRQVFSMLNRRAGGGGGVAGTHPKGSFIEFKSSSLLLLRKVAITSKKY